MTAPEGHPSVIHLKYGQPTKALSSQSETRFTTRQGLFASMIGSSIELFDFYLYATAAEIVFPRLFFAAFSPTAATLSIPPIVGYYLSASAA